MLFRSVNEKSTVAANSGARGAVAKPVHTGANEGGHHDSSAYKNATKDLIGKVGNTPGGDKKLKAEPAGHGAEKNGDNETGKNVGNDGKTNINKKSEIGGKVR